MDISKGAKTFFTTQLLNWHHTDNDRELPWKSEKDPYKIWLSEVILQQTRAAQGLPYYLNFTTSYPTINELAAAKDEEVFRIWQGLGYYNRCRNMLATARYISNELNGKFPDAYDSILSLKGIGPYTAAAIASFAYGLPHAVVDGNVYRVLSRYFGIDTPFDTTAGKSEFSVLAQQLLPANESSPYNQAIMDLGATVCTPRNPRCNECPVQARCVAYKQNMTDLLPVRSKKTQVNTRYFNYVIVEYKGKIWLHKRTGNDIWQNLYEPLLIETREAAVKDELGQLPEVVVPGIDLQESQLVATGQQRLTHRIIKSTFYIARPETLPKGLPEDGVWVAPENMHMIAFPKTVLTFLKMHYAGHFPR